MIRQWDSTVGFDSGHNVIYNSSRIQRGAVRGSLSEEHFRVRSGKECKC